MVKSEEPVKVGGIQVASEFTGRGDPRATLSLLWGLPRSIKPGRRPSLTPEVIGAAAIELADSAGLACLTMRALAERLDVSTMSLYRYVPGKAELLELIVELAYSELPQALPRRQWPAKLRRVARDSWDLYLRHSWMLEVSTYRAALGPHAFRKYERELMAIADAGLDEIGMELVISSVSDYVRGAARSAVEARAATEVTGHSNEEWWAAHSQVLQELVEPTAFPMATRVGSKVGAKYGGTIDPEHSFDFGLERLIDGIKGLVDRRAR